MFTNDDRSQLRREIAVAILGVVIGALTTFVNKFVETEYLFQRNLKVLEYDDDCTRGPDSSWVCELRLAASGLKEIKKLRISVDAPGNSKVLPVDLALAPEFAPPDPPPQIESSERDNSFLRLTVPRIREPQKLIWKVKVVSVSPIDPKDIHRVVSTDDSDARIEEGGSWRWKRWVPFGLFGLLVPLAIALLLLILMWLFRSAPEKGGFLCD